MIFKMLKVITKGQTLIIENMLELAAVASKI